MLLSLLGSSLVVPSAKVNQVPSASSQTCPFACNRWGFISPIRNMALNHQNKHLPWWCKYFLNWTSIKSCVYLHCLLRDTDCSRKTCHLWMGWSSLFTCILNLNYTSCFAYRKSNMYNEKNDCMKSIVVVTWVFCPLSFLQPHGKENYFELK